jgi:hypothetical protein
MKTEENGNDSIFLCRKALSPIKEIDELEVLERDTSLDREVFLQKSPRQSLIQPFQDPWNPPTIARPGICPNETTPQILHR